MLVNDLPTEFMLDLVATQLGNFIGHFLELDSKTVSLGFKRIM